MPFASFRWGNAGGLPDDLSEDEAYEAARQRVRARLSFYRHLATYLAVVIAVGFIDLVTGDGLWDFTVWLAGIWGAILVWQAFNVFVFPSIWNADTEERMIQEELRRYRRR